MKSLDRITIDPAVMGGKACIRGMRVTVGTVVGLLADGRSPAEILQVYPYLEREDIDQSLAYAAWRLEERSPPLHAMRPKLLVDMNLSPEWILALEKHGWQAMHWSDVGDPRASDRDIMDWAVAHQYVVFTLSRLAAAISQKQRASWGSRRYWEEHGQAIGDGNGQRALGE